MLNSFDIFGISTLFFEEEEETAGLGLLSDNKICSPDPLKLTNSHTQLQLTFFCFCFFIQI